MPDNTLDTYLAELRDETKAIVTSRLTQLSSLAEKQLRPFFESFADMSAGRRKQIISTLTELCEDNTDLDFTLIYFHGLKDTDGEVREKSVLGLWESDDRSLMNTFIDMLKNDPAEGVRSAVASTLRRFASLAELEMLLPKDKQAVAEALLNAIHNKSEPLSVRRRALESLGVLSIPEREAEIRAGYADPEPKMKASAVFAMGLTFHSAWLPVVIKELSNPDPEVRYEAATACGELGEAEALPSLLPLVRDRDTQTRLAAITSLGQIGGPQAKRALTVLLDSDDEAVREMAQEALTFADTMDDPLKFRDL